jgi:hypothetical protein
MSEYEIGRDLQDLRCRVEALEGGVHGRGGLRFATGAMEKLSVAPGIDLQAAPIVWKQKKDEHLPPFANRLLGLHPALKLDAAESTTWSCTPEPLIITVNWDAGGTDEFFRWQNQSFTILRATDPNTGITSAAATDEAQLIASGKATNVNDGQFFFEMTLRNAQGGPVGYPSIYPGNSISVGCQDNRDFTVGGAFNPGLYNLVTGANWYITNFRAHRC